MDDTISRQEAINALKRDAEVLGIEPYDSGYTPFDAIITINAIRSAQPEIIRCRDCRWRKDQSGSTAWLPCRAIVTPSDFYCGRAERRTDGN